MKEKEAISKARGLGARPVGGLLPPPHEGGEALGIAGISFAHF